MTFARLHSIPLQSGKELICFLSVLLLVCCLPVASAQQQSDGDSTQQTEHVTNVNDGKAIHFKIEKEITIKTKSMQPPQSTACQATLLVEFTQRNTMAEVDGTIENTTCGASSGDYDLGISVKDATGEIKVLEFNEKWQRSDDKNVAFSSKFPIGDNSDLLRVKVHAVHCTCADMAVK